MHVIDARAIDAAVAEPDAIEIASRHRTSFAKGKNIDAISLVSCAWRFCSRRPYWPLTELAMGDYVLYKPVSLRLSAMGCINLW